MEQTELLLNGLLFLILFGIVYVFTYFLNLKKYKKKQRKKISELNYLVLKFNLDIDTLDVKKMLKWISLFDAFIMAFVATFIGLIEVDIVWQLLIGFVLLVALIYAIFEIYGRHLVNKARRD